MFWNDIPKYQYELTFHKQKTTPILILKLTPLKDNLYPQFYNITIMIYTSGRVQLIWSENSNNLNDILMSLDEQFVFIEDSLLDVWEFLKSFLLQSFIIKDTSDSGILKKKNKYKNTVLGILPYRKTVRIKVGNEIQYYDENNNEWKEEIGIVKKINPYKVKWPENINYPTEFENTNLIRLKNQSSSRINRPQEEPQPYSFHGKCPETDKFIPFGGIQSYDNLYYPACIKKTEDKYNIYINQILKGFPEEEKDEINFQLIRNSPEDKYSGILKQKKIVEGSEVYYLNPKTKKKSQGIVQSKRIENKKGFDNNVIYTIEDKNTKEILDIKGTDFDIIKERENRSWDGLGNKYVREKLYKCSQNLGLTQPKYLLEYEKIKERNSILNTIENDLKIKEPPQIILFSIYSINNFIKKSYISFSIPKQSQRVTVFINENMMYLINNEKTKIEKIRLQNKFEKIVFDGFLRENIYYPINCLYYINENISRSQYINKNFDDFDENQNQGKLFLIISIVNTLNKNYTGRIHFGNIKNIISPKITGLINNKPSIQNLKKNSLLKNLSKTNTNNIIFIPQNYGNYIQYNSQLKMSIVLEIIENVGNKVRVGISNTYIKPINNTLISIPTNFGEKKSKYIRFYLRFDNYEKNKLNLENPLVFYKFATKKELFNLEKTKNIINILLNPIKNEMFKNPNQWIDPKGIVYTSSDIEPGINPLQIKS